MTKLFIVYATFLQVLVLIKINNQLIATYFYRSSALHNYIVHQLLLCCHANTSAGSVF